MHINESLASVSISIKAEVSAVFLSEEFMCVGNKLLRRKDIDDDLREAIVAPINVGRVIRSFTDKGQIVHCSGKLQGARELHLRLYR